MANPSEEAVTVESILQCPSCDGQMRQQQEAPYAWVCPEERGGCGYSEER